MGSPRHAKHTELNGSPIYEYSHGSAAATTRTEQLAWVAAPCPGSDRTIFQLKSSVRSLKQKIAHTNQNIILLTAIKDAKPVTVTAIDCKSEKSEKSVLDAISSPLECGIQVVTNISITIPLIERLGVYYNELKLGEQLGKAGAIAIMLLNNLECQWKTCKTQHASISRQLAYLFLRFHATLFSWVQQWRRLKENYDIKFEYFTKQTGTRSGKTPLFMLIPFFTKWNALMKNVPIRTNVMHDFKTVLGDSSVESRSTMKSFYENGLVSLYTSIYGETSVEVIQMENPGMYLYLGCFLDRQDQWRTNNPWSATIACSTFMNNFTPIFVEPKPEKESRVSKEPKEESKEPKEESKEEE
jgi:hypothetical protein